MAHREIIADGDVQRLQVFVKHVVHIGKACVRTLILGKVAHDNAPQPAEDAPDVQQVKHAVDFGNGSHILLLIVGVTQRDLSLIVEAEHAEDERDDVQLHHD